MQSSSVLSPWYRTAHTAIDKLPPWPTPVTTWCAWHQSHCINIIWSATKANLTATPCDWSPLRQPNQLAKHSLQHTQNKKLSGWPMLHHNLWQVNNDNTIISGQYAKGTSLQHVPSTNNTELFTPILCSSCINHQQPILLRCSSYLSTIPTLTCSSDKKLQHRRTMPLWTTTSPPDKWLIVFVHCKGKQPKTPACNNQAHHRTKHSIPAPHYHSSQLITTNPPFLEVPLPYWNHPAMPTLNRKCIVCILMQRWYKQATQLTETMFFNPHGCLLCTNTEHWHDQTPHNRPNTTC